MVVEPANREYEYEWEKGFYHMVDLSPFPRPETELLYHVPIGHDLLLFMIHEKDLEGRPPAYELTDGYVIIELPLPRWMESIQVGKSKLVREPRP